MLLFEVYIERDSPALQRMFSTGVHYRRFEFQNDIVTCPVLPAPWPRLFDEVGKFRVKLYDRRIWSECRTERVAGIRYAKSVDRNSNLISRSI